MKDTEYTFAVARIRANEGKLLTSHELSSVIAAASYEEASRRLGDRGYEISESDYMPALEKKRSDMLQLITEVLPDKAQFDSIFILNDFQNLKTLLKGIVCEKTTDELFVSPTVFDAAEVAKNVRARNNSLLPEPLQHADRSGYRILTSTHFAQLADSVIDRAAMEWAIKYSERSDNLIMREIAQTRAATADIKVLYRCIRAQKAQSFMERCVCACDAFEKGRIIKAACEGMESFLEFLSHTDYAGAAEALKESTTAFEKWCDDRMMSLMQRAKGETFGIAPVVAYYHAVETEVRNVRIILSAKKNGLPEEEVRQRVRELYV